MKSIKGKNGSNNFKGLLSLYDYIYDLKNKHPNHSDKKYHNVVGFEKESNRRSILRNYLNIQQQMDLIHSLQEGKKSCGRKSSYGSSLMLSLPSIIKLENKDYKTIRDLILIKLVMFLSNEYNLNYTKEQRNKYINNYILSSVHIQNNNDHINILIPNVMVDYNNSNKLVRTNLGKKKISFFIKNTFNKIMLDRFQTNYLDYEIKSHEIQKKKNTQYNHKLNEVEQQKQDLQTQIKEVSFLFENTNETIQKLNKRVSIYLNRMDTSILENDKNKFDKNEKLVSSNIDKIKKELEKLPTQNEDLNVNRFDKIKQELLNKSYNNFNPTLTR